jgi:hypothetical protein
MDNDDNAGIQLQFYYCFDAIVPILYIDGNFIIFTHLHTILKHNSFQTMDTFAHTIFSNVKICKPQFKFKVIS